MTKARNKMHFFTETDSITRNVVIQGKQYPVAVSGAGNIPCLSIGIGTLMQKTLSPEFKKHFTLYSTDSYWTQAGRLENPKRLTMDSIVLDVLSTAQQLNLKDYMLMGNSCFGIVAIEAARRRDPNLKGVIAVATATCWNDDMINFTNDYFNKHAGSDRIANHQARREHFAKIRKPGESEVSLNGYEADSAKYWNDFNITRSELEELWEGIEGDDDMMNHFFGDLLPKFDLKIGIEEIDVPVVIVGGRQDYDSLPFELWKNYPKPKKFSMIDCGDAGHWPHYENRDFFDKEIVKWVEENTIISTEK